MNSRLRNFLTTGSLGSDEDEKKKNKAPATAPAGSLKVEPATPVPEPKEKAPAPAPALQPTAAVPAAAPATSTAPAPEPKKETPVTAIPIAVPEPAVQTARPAPQPVPVKITIREERESRPTVMASSPRPARAAEGTPTIAPANPSRGAQYDPAFRTELTALRTEVAALKETDDRTRTTLKEEYLTSREQMRAYQTSLDKRDAEFANKKLMGLLEQVSIMREDFFRLCDGMTAKIDSFTAPEVLDSFKAYEVDLENILHDAGVRIGPYGTDGDRINTMHQRIVGVTPTNDPDRNGQVAERLADGYEYNGRVLLKEKVNVFKTTEKPITAGPTDAASAVPAEPAAEPSVPVTPAETAPAVPTKKKAQRKRRSKKSIKNPVKQNPVREENNRTDGNKTTEE